jgi:hypothetical protein
MTVLLETMRYLLLVPVLLTLLTPLSSGAAESPNSAERSQSCREAATAAERRYRIPAGLLSAIALVETGRTLPGTGARTAWPWTIHAEGKGRWLDSPEEAVAMVKALKAKGVKNIDVGCMQINQMHHPDAFPNLKTAFTPAANADYAARFLSELFQETRSWIKAASYYHSRTPERSKRYKKLVLAAWNGRATSARRAARAEIQARTGRNVQASRLLRVNRSTVYIQSGRNSIRIKRY